MKKISIVFFMLLFCSLFFISGCKTAEDLFDIRGTWNVTLVYTDGYTISGTWTFSGTETSGTYIDMVWGGSGVYTVTNNSVSIFIDWGSNSATYTGTATDDNNMSGTFSEAAGWAGSTWSAFR